jgi:hypothetical protein
MDVAQDCFEEAAQRGDVSTLRSRFGVLAAMVALGDFLLFRHSLGISFVLFVGVVEIATVLMAGAAQRKAMVCALVGAVTLAPVFEDVSALSLIIASCGAGAIALIANGGIHGSFVERVLQVGKFLAVGPFRILLDMPDVDRKALKAGFSGRALIAWIVPVGLGSVFLALFAAANPVVEGWFADIDLRPLLALLDVWRLAFWMALLILVWPFVLYRPLKGNKPVDGAPEPDTMGAENSAPGDFVTMVFGEAAILRSLSLFNLMFAVQTTLDIAILWRGHSLPPGLSFASYAHRGAYPLMVTALLAGAFVILAMRPGSAASQSRLIRTLVYIWTAQNVLLVISSLYRLELYVRVYSLTYWRVAAFVWMGLVAVGLVLVIVQLHTRRSNRWLVSANAVATMVALYLSAFVNFDYWIAEYNIHHCHEANNESLLLDVNYIQSLGPNAIPAMDEALAMPASPFDGRLSSVRSAMGAALQSRPDEWRSWTFREWRLSRYLKAESGNPAKP